MQILKQFLTLFLYELGHYCVSAVNKSGYDDGIQLIYFNCNYCLVNIVHQFLRQLFREGFKNITKLYNKYIATCKYVFK